ncbi:TIGR02302 family protein [Rhodobacteraceae bacterium NNCM2]|nr:TIGR02302 family protein [Coraliihabitans acroporae]
MATFSFRGKIRGHGRDLRRRIRLSKLAIWAERLAVALWPAFSVICLFMALALIGTFEHTGPIGHRVLLGSFALALAACLVFGLWRFRKPRQTEAMDRLDADHPARPLATMSDRLASRASDARTDAIWLAHQRRAEAAALTLRPAAPDLRLARRDRWALRLFTPALLLAAVISADEGWLDQLIGAAKPAPLGPESAAAVAREPIVEAWATPPAYTGHETVYLTAQAAGQPVSLPAGAEITIRATDFDNTAVLDAPGLSGVADFQSLGGGLTEVVTELESSGPIRVLDGETLMAEWLIEMIPDQPPVIETTSLPAPTLTRALEIKFSASDDYGIAAAWAEIQPVAEDRGKGLELDPITFALPLPITRDTRSVTDGIIEDLTEHPWAGSMVELVLYAEDGAGQIGTSETTTMRLPGRHFSDPLAAALIEQRRDLALDFSTAMRVLDVIQSITKRPEAIFEDRHGAYLGTRVVVRRLAGGVATETIPEAAPEIVDLLWDIALSLEQGDMSDALKNLRDAEQALRDALENGTDEEIARAIEQLRQAMNEYIQELARQALENPQAQQQQRGQQQGQQLSQQDLEEMLNEMQRRAESGLRDQARDMLSELSRMLENLQAGQPQMQPGGQGQQAMQELQEMIQRQRDLADRTFDDLREQRRQQQGQSGQGNRNEQGQPQPGQRPGEGGTGQGNSPGQGQQSGGQGQEGLAAQQEALRRALDELARSLPGGEGAAKALGEAGEAMGSARDRLEQGDNSSAVQDQMEALDRMNEGAQALADQMQNGQGDVGAQGRGQRDGQARDRAETDPFDRPLGSYGATAGNQTKVPDRSALDRAREILDELRRRSAESFRPELELDYFDRLLDQF